MELKPFSSISCDSITESGASVGKADWNPGSSAVTGFWKWWVSNLKSNAFALLALLRFSPAPTHWEFVQETPIKRAQCGGCSPTSVGVLGKGWGSVTVQNEIFGSLSLKVCPSPKRKCTEKQPPTTRPENYLHSSLVPCRNLHAETNLMGSYRHHAQEVFLFGKLSGNSFGIVGIFQSYGF